MGKIISIVIMFLFLVSIVGTIGVSAQEEMVSESYGYPGYPVYSDTTTNQQFYTVVFDEEGQVSVAGRLVYVNTNKDKCTDLNKCIGSTMSSISLQIPGSNVRIINIFQEVYDTEEVCQYYEEVCTLFENGKCSTYTKTCANYYTQTVYPPKYILVNNELSPDGSYKLTLPQPAKQGEFVTLLVYYKADGFVEENTLTSGFAFETIKSNFDVNYVTVSVDVTGDNRILGVDSNVNYQPNFAALANSYVGKEAFASDELYRTSQNIGYGGYTETASLLDPMESFTVDGKYSDSWIVFNWGKFLTVVILLLAFVGFGYGGYKVLSKATNSINSNKKSKTRKSISLGNLFFIGGGSAVLMVVLLWVGKFVSSLLPYGMNYQTRATIGLLIGLIELLIVFFLTFGPSIYIGVKEGAERGFIVFGITIGALIILGILSIVVLLIFSSSLMGMSPQIYY